MSIFGSHSGPGPNNSSAGPTSPAGVYGRGDLQAAFNWLVNQPEHIRKQASDPDRLMTLYYRSSGRTDMIRETRETVTKTESIVSGNSNARIETEAPVSGQTFISDLRQINEALRQFDGPTAQATIHTPLPPPQPVFTPPPPPPAVMAGPAIHVAAQPTALNGKTQNLLSEVREKLNFSSDVEALNVLVSLGYRALKPLLD